MDELMAYVNSKSQFDVTVRYGTLDDYTRVSVLQMQLNYLNSRHCEIHRLSLSVDKLL